MAFFRMILPAGLAGGYASLLVVVLIFFLNPALHLDPSTLGRFLPLALLLWVPAALIWPLLYRFIRVFARRRLRVRWYSFKYLLGFATMNLVLVSTLYWYNASLQRTLIPPAMNLRLRIASSLLSLATLFFVTVLAIPGLRRHRGVHVSCYAVGGLLALGLAAARTGYRPPPASPYTFELARPSAAAARVLVFGIEGGTLDQVLPLAAQGKLPWMARLLKRGSHGRLTPFRPCVPPVIWESLFTGMFPYKHQILDAFRYSREGAEVRVPPRGFAFRRLSALSGLTARPQRAAEASALSFTEILERLGEPVRWIQGGAASPPVSEAWSEGVLGRFLDLESPAPPGTEELPGWLARAAEEDREAAEAALTAWRETGSGVVVVILPGLRRVAHLFLRYTMPTSFGNVSPPEVEKYGLVLERYYRYLDDLLGRFLEREGASGVTEGEASGDLILVISPYGVDPLPLPGRVRAALEGKRFDSGSQARAPDGMLLAAGPGIRRGAPLGKSSVLDVAPTVLYLFGLPIGVDMDGHPLTRLFEPSFISEHPVLLIPSYEASRIGGRRKASPVLP